MLLVPLHTPLNHATRLLAFVNPNAELKIKQTIIIGFIESCNQKLDFKNLTLRCPGFFYTSDVQRGGKITPHVYLEFCGTYEKNSNSYSHVFELKLFNGANCYIAGSRM